MTETQTISAERNDILSLLAERRHFLRFTAQGLTDEQARDKAQAKLRAEEQKKSAKKVAKR